MTYNVCNGVTNVVTNRVGNDGRTHVQNQNQNQSLYVTVVCCLVALVSEYNLVRARGSSRPLVACRHEQATT